MTRLATRRIAEEAMDDPALPATVYDAVLGDLARVNRVTMAARPTLAFLDGLAARGDHLRILDVGFGQGDMLRAIARWGWRRGVSLSLVGVDLNPRSKVAASRVTPPDMPIRYVTGDYADWSRDADGSRFDIICSSLVAHHMTDDELVAFVRFMEGSAVRGWIVNDLHRHRLAHIAYPWLARMMRVHPIVRADGHLSIERSYRPGEWPRVLAAAGIPPGAATVRRRFPFRLCVERARTAA